MKNIRENTESHRSFYFIHTQFGLTFVHFPIFNDEKLFILLLSLVVVFEKHSSRHECKEQWRKKRKKNRKEQEKKLTKPETIKVSFMHNTLKSLLRSVFCINILPVMILCFRKIWLSEEIQNTENVYEKPEMTIGSERFVSKVVVEFCVVHYLHWISMWSIHLDAFDNVSVLLVGISTPYKIIPAQNRHRK